MRLTPFLIALAIAGTIAYFLGVLWTRVVMGIG